MEKKVHRRCRGALGRPTAGTLVIDGDGWVFRSLGPSLCNIHLAVALALDVTRTRTPLTHPPAPTHIHTLLT